MTGKTLKLPPKDLRIKTSVSWGIDFKWKNWTITSKELCEMTLHVSAFVLFWDNILYSPGLLHTLGSPSIASLVLGV